MGTGIHPQFMHSRQVGAPQMGGAAGAEGQILQVLDACLVTGFNPQTATTVAVDGDYIKITFGVTHGYERLQFIIISGATDAALNGKHRIIATTETTIKIAKSTVTDLTGTITTKIAPLDWESMFGSNDALKRAYRSKNLQGTRSVLYLDCQLKNPEKYHASKPIKKAIMNVCADMQVLGEQLDSYTSTYNAQDTDGVLQWMQASHTSYNADATGMGERDWVLFGDGDVFYFCPAYHHYSNYEHTRRAKCIYMFGDLPKLSPVDNYNCIFSFSEMKMPTRYNITSYESDYFANGGFVNYSNDNYQYNFYIRPISGIGLLDRAYQYSNMLNSSSSYSGGYDTPSFNNPLTMGLHFSDIATLRKTGGFAANNLPYLKTIATNLDSFRDQTEHNPFDLKHFNNHFVFRVGRNNNRDNSPAYMAIDLTEERAADVTA